MGTRLCSFFVDRKQNKCYNIISRWGGRLGRKQARCNFLSKTNKTKYFQVFVDKTKQMVYYSNCK